MKKDLLRDKSCSSNVADVVIARKPTALLSEGQWLKFSRSIDPLILGYFCTSSIVVYPKVFMSCGGEVIFPHDS